MKQILEDQALSQEEEELFNQLKQMENEEKRPYITSSERKREEEKNDSIGSDHFDLPQQKTRNKPSIFKLKGA